MSNIRNIYSGEGSRESKLNGFRSDMKQQERDLGSEEMGSRKSKNNTQLAKVNVQDIDKVIFPSMKLSQI